MPIFYEFRCRCGAAAERLGSYLLDITSIVEIRLDHNDDYQIWMSSGNVYFFYPSEYKNLKEVFEKNGIRAFDRNRKRIF